LIIIPCLHDEANIKQKHEVNLEHTLCTRILNTFASCLLHRVNGVLDSANAVHVFNFTHFVSYSLVV